jgi:hypothetical protein
VIVQAPVSVGELLDKLSILRIKEARFTHEDKRANVRRELRELQQVADALGLCHEALEAELDAVNGALWDVEDELRVLESRQDFGSRFVELARAVYVTNDRRAAVKRRLNEHFGSSLVEEKQYVEYGAGAGLA